jgi:Icc-related predicted phosphoesterase
MNDYPGTDPVSGKEVVRIAAMADVHCKRTSQNALKPLFAQAAEGADVLLLCGDLTDYGLPEEARILAAEVKTASARIPVLAVLGNHDYESGRVEEVRRILCDAGVVMLDGNCYEVRGIGFTGVRGFAGGFDERALQPWGEEAIKQFVHEAVNEALKLESGLAKLESAQRVVLLHYAPIRATVEGEPLEIFPFLGSSRLEEPLNHFPVTAVFHGHAHHGTPEGQTQGGVPVYNVAVPVLKRRFPGLPPFRVLEVPAVETVVEPAP